MVQVHDYLRPLMLKDLRTQCRARGINPGGSREALAERVGEHMLATQDFTIFAEAPLAPGAAEGGAVTYMSRAAADQLNQPQHMNNYSRPNGQNVGNHITDRPSSRVTAPPGGASQVDFGGYGGGMDEAVQPALADVSNQHVSRSAEAGPKAPAHAAHEELVQGDAPQQHGHFSGHGMSRAGGVAINNYNRSEGQNVGNFLSDRPSSRVLAPPGGASQVFFG